MKDDVGWVVANKYHTLRRSLAIAIAILLRTTTIRISLETINKFFGWAKSSVQFQNYSGDAAFYLNAEVIPFKGIMTNLLQLE